MQKKIIYLLILVYISLNIYWFTMNYISIYPVIFSIAMVLFYFTVKEKVKTTKKGYTYSYFRKKGYNYYSLENSKLNVTNKEFICNGKISEKFSLDLLKKYSNKELTSILKTYFTIQKMKNINNQDALKTMLLNVYMDFADTNTKNIKIEVYKEIKITYKFVSHELTEDEIDEIYRKLNKVLDLVEDKLYHL